MAVDKDGEWVAQNPGKGQTPDGWDPTGPANSYGYDEHGKLMQHIVNRPKCSSGQVVEVWREASLAWTKDPTTGAWVRDASVPDVVTVRTRDGGYRDVTWDSVVKPPPLRNGLDGWHMGHVPAAKYEKKLDKYLGHGYDPTDSAKNLEGFLADYHNPEHYRVEDGPHNSSHVDE